MNPLTKLIVISMIICGVVISASATDVIDLSTIGKKPVIEPVSLPRYTTYTPLVGNMENASPTGVLDLSTLNQKATTSNVQATPLGGTKPITVTPSFSVMNANITSGANSVYSPAITLNGSNLNYLVPNVTVYTPPIAIFGGA